MTDGSSNDWSPTWSSDGRSLFFVSNRGGTSDLWKQRITVDGNPDGDPEPVTTAVSMRRAVFSSDGTKLAYAQGQMVANVWRVPILEDRLATWADARPITSDHAWIEHLDLSPDGKRLLVGSDRTGDPNLWMLPSEGGEMLPMTTDLTGDWAPRWSPDGTEIAFYSHRSGNRDIWMMSAAGGPAKSLAPHTATDWMPVWSPDGNQIAFSSFRTGTQEAWIVPTRGGEPTRIARDASIGNPSDWSPDGMWLLSRSSDGRLWRTRASNGEAEPIFSSSQQPRTPRWSPDGKGIFYIACCDGGSDLWFVSLAAGREYPLTELRGRPGVVGVWSLASDGEYVYFTWEEDLSNIWLMDYVAAQR